MVSRTGIGGIHGVIQQTAHARHEQSYRAQRARTHLEAREQRSASRSATANRDLPPLKLVVQSCAQQLIIAFGPWGHKVSGEGVGFRGKISRWK